MQKYQFQTLRELREEARLSRADLAKRSGVSEAALFIFEMQEANPRIDVLLSLAPPLAERLGLPPSTVVRRLLNVRLFHKYANLRARMLRR